MNGGKPVDMHKYCFCRFRFYRSKYRIIIFSVCLLVNAAAAATAIYIFLRLILNWVSGSFVDPPRIYHNSNTFFTTFALLKIWQNVSYGVNMNNYKLHTKYNGRFGPNLYIYNIGWMIEGCRLQS